MTHLDTFVTRYLAAKTTYETSKLGPKTDAAWKRMERIMEQVDANGEAFAERFIQAVNGTQRY